MADIIRKVWGNKAIKQKLITIPKDADIEVGDYVSVEKIIVKKTLKGGKKK